MRHEGKDLPSGNQPQIGGWTIDNGSVTIKCDF